MRLAELAHPSSLALAEAIWRRAAASPVACYRRVAYVITVLTIEAFHALGTHRTGKSRLTEACPVTIAS